MATHDVDCHCPETEREDDWGPLLHQILGIKRVARTALDELNYGGNLFSCGVVASLVFSLGVLEASTLVNPAHSSRHLFCAQYGLCNVGPSIIRWPAITPELVAKALGYHAELVPNIPLYRRAPTNWLYNLLGRSPASSSPVPILRTIDQKTAAGAYVLLRAHTIFSARCIVASFFAIAELIGLVQSLREAGQTQRRKVMSGREAIPPTSTGFGKVVRFGGQNSACTETSVRTMGAHIFPILADQNVPSDADDDLADVHLPSWWPARGGEVVASRGWLRVFTKGGHIPRFWAVDPLRYGYLSSYESLQMDADWLVRPQEPRVSAAQLRIDRIATAMAVATAGPFEDAVPSYGSMAPAAPTPPGVLFLEADASVSSEPFSFVPPTTDDLSLTQAMQGFQALSTLARLGRVVDVAKGDRVARVLLAETDSSVRSGGGTDAPLREEAERLQLADIIIDAKSPIVLAIATWAERALRGAAPMPHLYTAARVADFLPSFRLGRDAPATAGPLAAVSSAEDRPRWVVFDTPNRRTFQTVRRLLLAFGWIVVDTTEPMLAAVGGPYGGAVPYLVYHDRTDETVSRIHAIVSKYNIPRRMVCGLFESSRGIEELKQMSSIMEFQAAQIRLADARRRLAETRKVIAKARNDAAHGGAPVHAPTEAAPRRLMEIPEAPSDPALSAAAHLFADDAQHEGSLRGDSEFRRRLSAIAATTEAIDDEIARSWQDAAGLPLPPHVPSMFSTSTASRPLAAPGDEVASVCSAEIYDDLFMMVRRRVMAGQSFMEIQRWLDAVANNAVPLLHLGREYVASLPR